MGHFLLCAGLKQHSFFFFLISSILEPPVIEKGIGLIMQEGAQLCEGIKVPCIGNPEEVLEITGDPTQ